MNATAKKTSYGVGIRNYFIIFSVLCAVNIALGTWKYKNVSDRFISPIEYFDLTIQYIRSYFPSFLLLLFCVLIQAILSFVIEKALINNYVSESTGLAYHIMNSLLPTNFTLVSSHLVYIEPCTLFFAVVHVVHITLLKGISYAFVNSQLRKEWRESKKEIKDNKQDIKCIYPQNINLKDTLHFWFATPYGTYKPQSPHIVNLNLTCLRVGIVKAIISTYISLNLLHVFVFPEVKDCVEFIENGAFFEAFRCFIRILIPVHILWLIAIYYFAFIVITGTWCKVVGYTTNKQKDWWNSTTMSEFWTKWNYFVHEWYRENILIPFVKNGINKDYAIVAVFAFSGLLHVFFTELPLRLYTGLTLFGMLMQMPQNDFSRHVKQTYGPRISNCLVLLQFVIGQPVFSIFFYYYYKYLNLN